MKQPTIIQGGMGVAISDWKLARAVSQLGQMGVVSGTGIANVVANRLATGDLTGHMRRALTNVPLPDVIKSILDRYYVPGGKRVGAPYKLPAKFTAHPPQSLNQFTAIANFIEVYLAKENHAGLVGINLLEKVQMPTLASLYGAMLAGVDYVLMGAGVPTQVARVLDKLANHEPVSYRLDVHGACAVDDFRIYFDPAVVFPGLAQLAGKLKRPQFLPIISSVVLAQALSKRGNDDVQGFIIEGPTAGGHNAPPRGAMRLSDRGEPIYSAKDVVDLNKIKPLGLPFWLAGGYGNPTQVKQALEVGATGVQVGTAFALCEESGLDTELKTRLLSRVRADEAMVFTSPMVSPTGFPFKVARLEGTLSDQAIYEDRNRICDAGYLRVVYKRDDGSLGYRCTAEPVEDYVAKGGKAEDTVGRLCLCNHLGAAAGFPRHRKSGYVEKPIVTSGHDLAAVGQYLRPGNITYKAKDVVEHLLSGLKPAGILGAV
jgi:nitronate monooxygenase